MSAIDETIQIPINDGLILHGKLHVRENSKGIVLFAHGSGSGRYSPRNMYVATVLQNTGLGTLLFDLLTEEEEAIDEQTRHLRFDIALLADRLVGATDWLARTYSGLDFAYFGASTGAAAALVAAAQRGDLVRAVVSRGGRPDLADKYLEQVRVPTLLIVGGEDKQVIGMNQEALKKLRLLKDSEKKLTIVAGATHLFEQIGTLEQVASLASEWFSQFLIRSKANFQEAS